MKLDQNALVRLERLLTAGESQAEGAGLLGVSVRMNREGRGSNEVAREAPDQVGQERQGPQPIIAGEVHLTPQLLIEDDCQVRWQALPSRGPRPLVRGN